MSIHTHEEAHTAEANAREIPCDLCGSGETEEVGRARASRARAVICRRCGLVFISPRMDRAWYDHFYQEEYREKEGQLTSLEKVFEKGKRHGKALAEELRPYLLKSGLLVEVGSSAGGVLAGIRESLGVDVLGIEPSVREAGYAEARGVPTKVTLIEDIERKGIQIPPADQILSTQSLNHFLSPKFFFAWAWRQLKPGGRLIIEVKNFRQQARRSGHVARSIQPDHLYMFTPETLAEYFAASGFRALTQTDDETLSLREIHRRRDIGLPGYQIRAVAEKTDRAPFANVASAINSSAYPRVSASLRPWRIAAHHFFRYRRFVEFFQ